MGLDAVIAQSLLQLEHIFRRFVAVESRGYRDADVAARIAFIQVGGSRSESRKGN